ncbi:MAG: hypothetical protein RL662_2390 [Bacteroidota bacterium]|jgi:hypothetical protein
MNELSDLIDLMDVTSEVYVEALRICDKTKRNQTLYVWNITKDSYDYVICDTVDAIPDVVTEPFVPRHFLYKEKPHE